MAGREEERRIYEHFVVAGLDKNSLEQLSPSSQECGCRNNQPLAPITDICVIFPSLGETMPDGFEMITTTPLGYPADLNHGSMRIASVFIGFRRGFHKAPLVDIGVLDQGRGDKPMVDANTIQTTPFGRVANVNNASQGIFLTYRRAPLNTAPSQFVVTHICVILANKGEVPPHTYYKIPKNLNKGMMGSDVFICYKKTQGTSKRLAYKPTVLDSFPSRIDDSENTNLRLEQNVPLFCLPMGALIECWPAKCQPPEKSFTTFVLTDENGTKFYGAAVSFYEKYNEKLTDEQMEQLELLPGDQSQEYGAVEDSSSNNDPADQMEFHTNMAICLISRYPFFYSFKRFLYYLHRISAGLSKTSVPIERYLSHLRYEVSFPTPRRPHVLMQLGNETISFESHDDFQLPLNGAQLYEALKNLGSENLMYLMLLALLEQKILIHSLRSWLLTAVAESICALMFPFHWQCPYVPQCPLGLAGVLHAPLPFIAGVDSRYFELYEDPPEDVTCFDLDTSTISWSTIKQTIKLSMLPKKAAKQLKNTLDDLVRTISTQSFEVTSMQKKADFLPVIVEQQNQRKRKEVETEIQEAFLRFMAQLIRGYQSYLRPIKTASATVNATDTGNLFDLNGFLRSRDKTGEVFFKKFCETQSFIRFIEERSFVSDKNTYHAFFDDCMNKVISSDEGLNVSLLESDTTMSEKHPSVFIATPEPLIDPSTGEERIFEYNGFPRKLNPVLFQLDQLNTNQVIDSEKVPVQHEVARSAAIRTKPEVRSAHLAASNATRNNPLFWPKTILFYTYSLWFMQLPSLLVIAPNKRKILRLAFHVLDRLEQSGIPLIDQVCYRIVIELCGEYGEPTLAVKVLQAMQRSGLEQNAVTYGIYHRAVMNATWPSEARQNAIRAWNKLRLALNGVARFKFGFEFENKPEEQKPSPSPVPDLNKVDFTITYSSLDEPTEDKNVDPLGVDSNSLDPLGVLSPSGASNDMTDQEKLAKATMSPSRAKFLEEHASTPFANEETPKASNKSSRSSSWFKGISNSPMMMKIMRSHTFENPKTPEVDKSSQVSVSPSLQALMSQVKKGYDDVVKDGVSSKIKMGMSSLVHEVRSLNKSYGHGGTSSLFGDDNSSSADSFDVLDMAYQLDEGNSGSLLNEDWWLSEVYQQLQRNEMRNKAKNSSESPLLTTTDSNIVEVTLCNATPCSNCQLVVYDEDILAGWKVDDYSMNIICPYCSQLTAPTEKEKNAMIITPTLTVEFNILLLPRGSWYAPSGLSDDRSQQKDSSIIAQTTETQAVSVPFVSPLVLRRELETLLATDLHALKSRSLMESHPIIFWNMVYYMRRLGVPSHLFSLIAPRHQIRCVYDRPSLHKKALPLYFSNPNHNFSLKEEIRLRPQSVWNLLIQHVRENKLFSALQVLINDSRQKEDNMITLGPHFPMFRDVLFASIDEFGRGLLRDNLDTQYPVEFQRLPVRIRNLLPFQDMPQTHLQRACRKIFLPLDLI